jgi:hypothetical protein
MIPAVVVVAMVAIVAIVAAMAPMMPVMVPVPIAVSISERDIA